VYALIHSKAAYGLVLVNNDAFIQEIKVLNKAKLYRGWNDTYPDQSHKTSKLEHILRLEKVHRLGQVECIGQFGQDILDVAILRHVERILAPSEDLIVVVPQLCGRL
jgi:hypothetical protein